MAQQLPFKLTIAPFPEGFQGDMDETFQQAYQNTTAVVEGNFITGLVLPPGSTLPTTDQGPIAMNETWYFFDPTSGKYLPQTAPFKAAKNVVRNSCYQVAQTGPAFTLGGGITQTYDMCLARVTQGNVLAISVTTGPASGADNDLIPAAIEFTVGPALATTLASTDIFAHEHLIEGSDVIMLQGQQLALAFSVYPTVAGIYSVYLTNGARDHSYVANFTIGASQINTWVRIKIGNIPPFPTAGTWSYGQGTTGLYIGFPMGVGAQFQTATLNTWAGGFFAGSAQNVNMLTVVNNYLAITGVKLEAAPTPSYYQVPSFQTDFDEMQRYYTTSFDYQSTTSAWPIISDSGAANSAYFGQQFYHRMCKVPTVVPYGITSHTVGMVTDTATGTDIACATLPANRKGIGGQVTLTGVAKGDSVAAIFIADARLS